MKANMPLITMWIVCGIVTTIGMIITKDVFPYVNYYSSYLYNF